MNKTVKAYADALDYKHMAFSAFVTFAVGFVGFLASTIDPETLTLEALTKDFLLSAVFGAGVAGLKAVVQQSIVWWTSKTPSNGENAS